MASNQNERTRYTWRITYRQATSEIGQGDRFVTEEISGVSCNLDDRLVTIVDYLGDARAAQPVIAIPAGDVVSLRLITGDRPAPEKPPAFQVVGALSAEDAAAGQFHPPFDQVSKKTLRPVTQR